MGGFNPKFNEFKDKHHDLTLLGLGWAMYWRFMLIVLAIELVVFGLMFAVFASLGVSMHRDWDKDRGPGMQGKLNINVVCEGALAYMTFPDAKSADAFVQDCRDGKHPEVIERYKADMNLGEGVAI